MLMRYVVCGAPRTILPTHHDDRLRRAVLHPNLVLSSGQGGLAPTSANGNGTIDVKELIQRFGEGENAVGDNKVYAEGVLANLGQEDAECPICFDVMETPAILPDCMHQWCAISCGYV